MCRLFYFMELTKEENKYIDNRNANNVIAYTIKEGDVIYIPDTEKRKGSYSSQDLAKYLKIKYKDVKTTKDYTKCTVSLGMTWNTGDLNHYTWGDEGEVIKPNESGKFSQLAHNNTPYIKEGVTYNDAAILCKNPYQNYDMWRGVSCKVLVTHNSIDDDVFLLQKHLIDNKIPILIDVNKLMSEAYDELSTSKEKFTEADIDNIQRMRHVDDKSVIDLIRIAYKDRNLHDYRGFFVEEYYSRATKDYKVMIRSLFKKDPDMSSLFFSLTNRLMESNNLIHVAKRSKKLGINVDMNKILLSH